MYRLLLLICCGGAATASGFASLRDQVDIHTRHDAPPDDKTARFQFPTSSYTSALLTAHPPSPDNELKDNDAHLLMCAPERDGYFGGGTGGSPTAQLHIVGGTMLQHYDTLLAATFPGLCRGNALGTTARTTTKQLEGKVTGYHFGTVGT